MEVVFAFLDKPKNYQNPSSLPIKFGGKGDMITYLVVGDSTSAGQGAEYNEGIAVKTSEYLALNYTVSLINKSVSGARTADVYQQIRGINDLKPDVVLLSVGSNDVTNFTPPATIDKSLSRILQKIINSNCNVKIVITGAAEVSSSPRFLFPLSTLLGYQVKRVNAVYRRISDKYQIEFSPIAEKTGPVFKKDRKLFAADRFHPNATGYGVWNRILNNSLKNALESQPSHCK